MTTPTPSPASSLNNTLKASYQYGSSPLTPSSSTTRHQVYLFGYPIAHSLAPLLLNSLFNSLNLPWTYTLIESKDKSDFLPKLKSNDCIGSAITMPHKVPSLSEVDAITDEGRVIGAIKTVFIRLDKYGQRRYIGTNTDCIGVREAFLKNVSPELLAKNAGRPALVIGGGGACRSAVYALHAWLGAEKIYLVNRLKSEIDDIKASFQREGGFGDQLVFVETVEMARSLPTPFLVVGTIPDFPPREPEELVAKEITQELMGRKEAEEGVVLEMCYRPQIRTAFYESSERNGWTVLPGTESMIWQGVAQQVLWAEKERAEGDLGIEEARKTIKDTITKHG
jgi:quinate dehydrogenase